jgi:hypothetical protein
MIFHISVFSILLLAAFREYFATGRHSLGPGLGPVRRVSPHPRRS